MEIKEFEETSFADLVLEVKYWLSQNKNVEVKQFSHAVVEGSYSNHYKTILMYEKKEKEKTKKEKHLTYRKIYGGHDENKTF